MMMNILVECFPDDAVMQILGFRKKQVDHNNGKNRIGEKLQKGSGRTAMVDEDPGKSSHPYFLKLSQINAQIPFKNGYRILKDVKKNHIIIELEDRMERFILTLCRQYEISPGKYKFSNNESDLHAELTENSMERFRNLLESIGPVKEFHEIRNALLNHK